ncbi:MAG: SpoIIE family protein phosphatase [Planctomycetes bacterium]|nr:SpoIIE family protein phosphatase [Planctomycetota bacterium]
MFRSSSKKDEAASAARAAERHQILLDALADLASTLDLDEVLDRILARSLDLSGAERALVLLGDPDRGLRARRARAADGSGLATEEIIFSSTVVRSAFEQGVPVLHEIDSDSQALETGQSVFELKLRSVMCAPLAVRGEGIGAIYLDSRVQHKTFTGEDREMFQALARQAALAVRNAQLLAAAADRARLEREMELAAEIQRDLLPGTAPVLPGLEIAGRTVPCEEISGDFYDFVVLGDGRLALFVADVTGHGVGPALVAAEARGEIRALLPLEPDPGQILTRVHANLRQTLDPERFITLILALLDPDRGELLWANAGHAEGLLMRGGEPVWLGRSGPPLGVDVDHRHVSRLMTGIGPRDELLLYSDGLLEARNAAGDFFGEAGLAASAAAARGSAAERVDAILDQVRLFNAGPRNDDRTVVAVLWR